MAATPIERRILIAETPLEEREFMLVAVREEYGTPHAIYRDDPVGFFEDVLHEFMWSRQQLIARSVMKHTRTAVPSCFGSGKTHLSGRIVLWFCSVYRPGEALAVSTAKRWRQVRSQLWPHIRRAAKKANLPGRRNQTDWWIGDEQVAYGFAPDEHDEASSAGVHAPHLLILVDEAGGILPVLGNALNGLLVGDARILCIGNPSTDDAGTWFEGVCGSDLWNTIPIPAHATPNFTHEDCPPWVADQLIDDRWVKDTVYEYGDDSAYYISKVLAQFPKVFARKVIPVGWCEDAMDNDHPAVSGWQRLGVDVAAGGGDEMVVAYADGWTLSIVDVWSNADSADQVINANRVLDWIHKAEGRQKQLGFTDRRVRVKMDGIGVGSGTADILINMGRDGKHNADVVKVIVSESATENEMFARRRDECWWALREVIRDGTAKLKISEKEKAQLTGPTWKSNATGKTEVEQKAKMKARGVPSPDRADALCLAIYEPEQIADAESYAEQLAEAKLSTLARRYE